MRRIESRAWFMAGAMANPSTLRVIQQPAEPNHRCPGKTGGHWFGCSARARTDALDDSARSALRGARQRDSGEVVAVKARAAQSSHRPGGWHSEAAPRRNRWFTGSRCMNGVARMGGRGRHACSAPVRPVGAASGTPLRAPRIETAFHDACSILYQLVRRSLASGGGCARIGRINRAMRHSWPMRPVDDGARPDCRPNWAPPSVPGYRL